MKREEWRTSPSGVRWMLLRSWSARRYRFITVSIRSEAGATRYISGDEWEDWPLA